MSRIPQILSACLAATVGLGPAFAQTEKTEKAQPGEVVQVEETVEVETATVTPLVQDPADATRKQIAEINRELEFVKTIATSGGLIERVKHSAIGERPIEARSFDLGVEVPQPGITVAQPAQPQKSVRLLGDAEKERMGADVVFAVNGKPVSEDEYQVMFEYLKAAPGERAEEDLAKEAIRALVMQKAALARFDSQSVEALANIKAIEGELKSGGDFAAVAREKSMCPSASQGGDLGFFTKGRMDPMFERVAFTTKVGETSDVVQSAFGYHLIKVTAREEGEGDQPTRVKASHILVSFDANTQVVRQAMAQAANGQVDLAFVNDEWRKKSPF